MRACYWASMKSRWRKHRRDRRYKLPRTLTKSRELRQTFHTQPQSFVKPYVLKRRPSPAREGTHSVPLDSRLLLATELRVHHAKPVMIGNEHVRQLDAAPACGDRVVVVLQHNVNLGQRTEVDRGWMRINPHALLNIV